MWKYSYKAGPPALQVIIILKLQGLEPYNNNNHKVASPSSYFPFHYFDFAPRFRFRAFSLSFRVFVACGALFWCRLYTWCVRCRVCFALSLLFHLLVGSLAPFGYISGGALLRTLCGLHQQPLHRHLVLRQW
jgi:hypothetical protein